MIMFDVQFEKCSASFLSLLCCNRIMGFCKALRSCPLLVNMCVCACSCANELECFIKQVIILNNIIGFFLADFTLPFWTLLTHKIIGHQ